MKEILKELKKELLGKEITLLEVDNTTISIIGSTNSLFDTENDCIEQESCSYYVDTDKNVVIEFKILKKEKNNLETLVKVTKIWED